VTPTTGPTGLPFETVALVLQGGGALGSYQAGVYEGLADAGIAPNWIAGISIGALNTAVIAGNAPEDRVQKLRDFWETICRPAYAFPAAEWMQNWLTQVSPDSRRVFSGFEAWRAIVEGQRDFFTPRGPAPWLGAKEEVTALSFYDTAGLKSTLERFVDFDRLNAGDIRVSVGAVNVRTGNFAYFDNTQGKTRGRLRAEHFMASAALPPGFPAVEVDGEYYWDGGLVSNTPLGHVLAATPRRDTLCFQVDLWSARGRLPENVYDVQERQKDIQYSSRTRAVTDYMANEQHYRRMLREVLQHVPAKLRESDAWCRKADALSTSKQYSVIHLVYQDKEWEGLSKDYEFSPKTMHEHWESGLQDIRGTLAHPSWLALPPEGREFVTHDRHRPQGDGLDAPVEASTGGKG
jgi:NTE family protein